MRYEKPQIQIVLSIGGLGCLMEVYVTVFNSAVTERLPVRLKTQLWWQRTGRFG